MNNEFRSKFLLVIYDNSPESMLDVDISKNTIYKHDTFNLGLYTAYNYALDICRDNKIEWLTVFDQDTLIPSDFFSKLYTKSSTSSKEVGCIVPDVRLSNGKKISPGIIEDQLFILKNQKNRTRVAINSGNTIHVSSFDKTKPLFSKRYPLDFLDYDFFLRLSKKDLKIEELAVTEIQNLSVSNFSEMNVKRFKSFINYENKFVNDYYRNMRKQYALRLLVRILKLLGKKNQHDKVKIIFDAIKDNIK